MGNKLDHLKKFNIINKSTFITMLTALIATPCTYANVKHRTYLSMDPVYSKMRFRLGYGENVFATQPAPGLNLSLGHMFNNYFGGEIGFEFENKMSRTNTVFLRNTVLGVYFDPAGNSPESQSMRTTLSQRHPYFGLKANINITDIHVISLLAGVSVSSVTAKYNIFRKVDLGVSTNVNTPGTFSKTRIVPMIRASIEHKFNDKFGMRISSAWRNTSTFTIKPKDITSTNQNERVKLKDTINLGLGLMCYI